MCGRYVVVSSLETIENRFNVDGGDLSFEPQYNLALGNEAPIILDRNKHMLSVGQFGFSPSWAKKRMYLLNARSEGDNNKSNSVDYSGGKGIITKPAFRNSIRNKRCLVIADAFIEGTTKEKLSKPYLTYLKDKNRPFAFAGIYDDWVDAETGESFVCYAIITTVANKLIQKIPHHRSPVILKQQHEHLWLNQSAPLTDITNLLQPYPSEEMNAYPISDSIKHPSAEGKGLLNPIGNRLAGETEISFSKSYKLYGMGHSPARDRETKRK